MDFTIEFNSGGNHGHQLKDALGGLTAGCLFDLKYVHTPHKYLDYFGIGYQTPILKVWSRRLKYRRIKRMRGPFWEEAIYHISLFRDASRHLNGI
ncbi:MAG: hypothetical protein MI975_20845 [Cytophagales bacterium]|nr:hypothetical protein [Cytophagales bacterium]